MCVCGDVEMSNTVARSSAYKSFRYHHQRFGVAQYRVSVCRWRETAEPAKTTMPTSGKSIGEMVRHVQWKKDRAVRSEPFEPYAS